MVLFSKRDRHTHSYTATFFSWRVNLLLGLPLSLKGKVLCRDLRSYWLELSMLVKIPSIHGSYCLLRQLSKCEWYSAPASLTQWIECWPANQRVTGSIPSQGTCLGCRPRSPVEGTWEATTHWCFSPSLSPSLSLSINKSSFKKEENESFL